MKLVVDTNILFSFFKETSLTRKLIECSSFELISPKIAIDEIKKYSEEIIDKLNITKSEFNMLLEDIKRSINFIDKKEYADFINHAEKISPDLKDADFLALSMKESCPLWSNDNLLKKQNQITILNTNEIIDLLFG
jgi:predicted nucleic acid-binding protein